MDSNQKVKKLDQHWLQYSQKVQDVLKSHLHYMMCTGDPSRINNQHRHCRPFTFYPFLVGKPQNANVNNFKEHSPWKNVGFIFCWSHFWGNSLDFETLLTTYVHYTAFLKQYNRQKRMRASRQLLYMVRFIYLTFAFIVTIIQFQTVSL